MDRYDLSSYPEAPLEDVLEAREERALIQRDFLRQDKVPLLSFTLNIAGPHKIFPFAEAAFFEGDRLLHKKLAENNIKILSLRRICRTAGYEGFYSLMGDPRRIKELVFEIEDTPVIGRLFDMDVLTPGGDKICRRALGLPDRPCIICGNPVFECSRNRTHGVEALTLRTIDMIYGYFRQNFASKVSSLAVKALLFELAATPKPGLVDRSNSGAHADMDFYTFIGGISALAPYFSEAAMLGLSCGGGVPSLFKELRELGRKAEADMFTATGGVNTHKGAVFSLGILCAAAGMQYRQGVRGVEELLSRCGEIAKFSLSDFESPVYGLTHGGKAYAEHRVNGARGEAAAGFPSVWRHSFPALRSALERGFSANDASVFALLSLIAEVEDTNIISRASLKRQREIRAEVSALISKTGADAERVIASAARLDKKFIKENISPGGCADLLALTWLLQFLEPLI